MLLFKNLLEPSRDLKLRWSTDILAAGSLFNAHLVFHLLNPAQHLDNPKVGRARSGLMEHESDQLAV